MGSSPVSRIALNGMTHGYYSAFSSNRSFNALRMGGSGFYPPAMITNANKLNDSLSKTISDMQKVSPEMDLGDELKIMQDLDKLIPDLKKQSDEEKKALLEKAKKELGNEADLSDDGIDKAIKKARESRDVAKLESLKILQSEKNLLDQREKKLKDLEAKFKEVRPSFEEKDKDGKSTGKLYQDATQLNRLPQLERERIHREFKQKLADPLNGLEDNFELPTEDEIKALQAPSSPPTTATVTTTQTSIGKLTRTLDLLISPPSANSNFNAVEVS